MVTVFLRAPLGAGVCSMWLRSAPDGEAEYIEAVIDRRTEDEGWWRADLIIHNPDTNYRFLLDGGPFSYRWLTAAGLVLHDPTDATDFRLTAYDPPAGWGR